MFNGSGKLGFPEAVLFAFALGCDVVSVGREALLSIGCIQAQRCHTNHCPTGITTHNRWLVRGVDPVLKSSYEILTGRDQLDVPGGVMWYLTSNLDEALGPQLPSILNRLGADGWEVAGIGDLAFSKRPEIILKKLMD